MCAEDDNERPSRLPPGTVTSVEAFTEMGHQTSNSLGLAAEYASHQGNYEQAIKLCKRSLRKDIDDMDAHEAYAQALEQKMEKEGQDDITVYNECVKQWLVVLRNEAGEEKGQTFHGLGLLGTQYADEERGLLARQRLKVLTGSMPRPWETDVKYLKRVLKRTSELSGKVLHQNDDKSDRKNSK